MKGGKSKAKRHILFIPSWYPQKSDPTHGIFNHTMALAAGRHCRVSVLYVSSSEKTSENPEIAAGGNELLSEVFVHYKKYRGKIPLLSALIKRKRMIAAFEKGFGTIMAKAGKPDIIQLNVVMPAGIGALHLSKKHNIPLVISEHWSGYFPEDGNYRGVASKYLTKKIVSHAAIVMPVSEALEKAMLGHGLTGRYQVLPNVVDTELFRPGERNSNKITRFIHVSSLTDREKNVSGILRAFSNAISVNKELSLTVVGKGPERQRLEKLGKDLGLDKNVTFSNSLSQEDLAGEMHSHHALLMFSHFETFGIVVAEALASGIPVISSDTGMAATLIAGGNGVIVKRGSETALKNAILQFASSAPEFDREKTRQQIITNYSPESVGRKLSEIYEAVLNSKK